MGEKVRETVGEKGVEKGGREGGRREEVGAMEEIKWERE